MEIHINRGVKRQPDLLRGEARPYPARTIYKARQQAPKAKLIYD